MDQLLAISLSELLSLFGVTGIAGILHYLDKITKAARSVITRIDVLEDTVVKLQKTDALILRLLTERLKEEGD